MNQKNVQKIRLAVQWGFLFFCIYLGITFYRFVLHYRTAGATPFVERPNGVEAFLPISGLVSLKGWLVTGQINTVHPAAMVIFLSVVLVSLLLKRSFCSWICPVATITEVLWKVGLKGLGRNLNVPPYVDWLLRPIKYVLVLFFLVSIGLLMPAGTIDGFITSDYNKMADIKMLDFFVNLSGTPLVVIAGLLIASLFLKNPFCRFLCPYGALLGVLSKLSPVKVERCAGACISCAACTKACPSYIDVMNQGRVTSAECIGCLRCVSKCPKPEALQLRVRGGRVVNGVVFGALVVVLFVGGTLVGRATGHWQSSLDKAVYHRLLTEGLIEK